MVQANALLVAIALTVTVPKAHAAMPWPCWQVRMFAGGMSDAEIWQYAKSKKYRVTRRLEREVRACLGR